MRRSAGIVGLLVLVTVLIIGGFLAVDRLAGDEAGETVIVKPELGSTAIVRTDLVERETFGGVLRFADPQIVTTSMSGTVTRVREVGTLLDRGDTVVEIDGQPVLVLYGDRPMWRTLTLVGLDGNDIVGPDVEQLERNLFELGYPLLREEDEELPTLSAPDELFDDDTIRLIQDWREDIGLAAADSVEFGRIVYLSDTARVARVLAGEGSLVGPGSPILEVSTTAQEIYLRLPVDKRDLIEVGGAVRVTLPNDIVVAATVTSIGTLVSYFDEDSPGVIDVSISLDDPSLGAEFDESPVDVEIVANEVIDVLAVPVNALLALAEGGYALEVQRNGTSSLIEIETGIYVDGLVEVRGEIVVGDIVVVPK